MKKKILITSALPYANGPLHFGHIAGAYLPADAYARYERLKGNDVLYICGSDEYGVAITLTAELAGRTPKEHTDIFHKVNVDFFQKLGISFDHYSRTTCKEHAPAVTAFFQDLLKNGYIEPKETDQLYSETEHRFLADRYIVGTCPQCGFENARGDECSSCGASYEATHLKNPRSKLTGSPLILKKTTHYFLLFDKFKERLLHFLGSKNWKPNVMHFAARYVDEIHPRAITRDLEWGVPVPLKEAAGKVFYVWFDAPIGYISATQEWANQSNAPDKWKEYWLDPKTKYVQFIGKDNIPFHAIFFPAMIMGQEKSYKMVDELAANEFYNLEGRQFSKSDGWYIDLEDFFNRFEPDQIRYTIAANAPENADSEFTWKDFQTRCNADLLGKLGNLVNRVLVFLQNNLNGKVPAAHTLEDADYRFLAEMNRLAIEIDASYSQFKLRRVAALIMECASLGNSYFDAKAPWKDAKDANRRMVLETTIALCLRCIKALALFAFPIIPATSAKIWQMLGEEGRIEEENWDASLQTPLTPQKTLPQPFVLFKKVEDEVIEEEIGKLKKLEPLQKNKQPVSIHKESIDLEIFKKIDLRVGTILQVQKIEKSKKLYHIELAVGDEKRKVVSGIAQSYRPEELLGKKVVFVANLKPASIMGYESEGMILASTFTEGGKEKLELLLLEDAPSGSAIS